MLTTTRMRARRIAQPAGTVEVPTALVLELVSASLASGTSIPRAFTAVGDSIEGPHGDYLARTGRSLLLGASWNEAWANPPETLAIIPKTLRYAWEFGAPSADSLAAAREASEKESLAGAKERAQRLGVSLVVPLGLCFLPAFIALAVIPIVATLAEQWF